MDGGRPSFRDRNYGLNRVGLDVNFAIRLQSKQPRVFFRISLTAGDRGSCGDRAFSFLYVDI